MKKSLRDFVVKSDSFSIPSSLNRSNPCINLEVPNNNLKGLIIGENTTNTGIYIASIYNGVVYYLTTMPSFESTEGLKGNVGLSFIPVKVSSSNRVSDISNINVFGSLYSTVGTMSQSFGVRSIGLVTDYNFTLGYAANKYISANKIFELRDQVVQVVGPNNQGVTTVLSIFGTDTSQHQVNFTMIDDFNLVPNQIYAGVQYKMSFSGELFNIPFYPPLSSDPTKIDPDKLIYPGQFKPSTGINTYLIGSTLYQSSNCGIPMTTDPRDILSQNMKGTLPFVVFTNQQDCIAGINYNYCPSGVTCSGNCKSSCPTGECQYDASKSQFGCYIPIIPVNPIMQDIVPISEGIVFWLLLLILFVFIVLIIFAIYKSIGSSEQKDETESDKSSTSKEITKDPTSEQINE